MTIPYVIEEIQYFLSHADNASPPMTAEEKLKWIKDRIESSDEDADIRYQTLCNSLIDIVEKAAEMGEKSGNPIHSYYASSIESAIMREAAEHYSRLADRFGM